MRHAASHLYRIARKQGRYLLTGRFNPGYCPVCERRTLFVRRDAWLRDFYVCARCESIPRHRALLHVLGHEYPRWREARIYEAAAAGASSWALARGCRDYLSSYWWPDVEPGESRDGVRCEDLEGLSFDDASFDVVITQDVFEHVLNPQQAFAEVARVLKPGGAHVYTVPIYPRATTLVRAVARGDGIRYVEPPDYHGDPRDPNGSLVVREWGRDIVDFVRQSSGLDTVVHAESDRGLGLDGAFLEVLVSRKAG